MAEQQSERTTETAAWERYTFRTRDERLAEVLKSIHKNNRSLLVERALIRFFETKEGKSILGFLGVKDVFPEADASEKASAPEAFGEGNIPLVVSGAPSPTPLPGKALDSNGGKARRETSGKTASTDTPPGRSGVAQPEKEGSASNILGDFFAGDN